MKGDLTNTFKYKSEYRQSCELYCVNTLINRQERTGTFPLSTTMLVWGIPLKRMAQKMRILKTSLDNPQDYMEFPIKEGKKLSRLFSKESLTPTHNSFAVNPKLAE